MFPALERITGLRDGSELVWRLGRRRIPGSESDHDSFLKSRRPHFHIDVRPGGEGKIDISLYRIDFRGLTDHFRIGEANVLRWDGRERVPDAEELADAMSGFIGRMSLKQFNNWDDRLARRKWTSKAE
jgi:hypothetical protein